MSVTRDGIELETTMLGVSGRVELDDGQAEALSLGDTIQVTFRGRVLKKSDEAGGQHTVPRTIATVSLDVLDEIAVTDDLPGQMKLGDEPGEPSDDD